MTIFDDHFADTTVIKYFAYLPPSAPLNVQQTLGSLRTPA